MLVGSRMTPNPITVTPDLSIAEAMEWMKRENVRRFPVLNKAGKLIGIVTDDDLLHATPSSATSLSMWEVSYLLSKVTVKEVMAKDVITIDDDCPLEEAARIMADKKIGGLPVMRDGQLVGIITESDLFKVFLELFGAREKGVRLTVLAPYYKGSLAEISTAITKEGGNILAMNVFLGEDPSNWGCYLKVSEITRDDLIAAVEPLVEKVVDVRET
jgi:acetoin utilization protein AcuB